MSRSRVSFEEQGQTPQETTPQQTLHTQKLDATQNDYFGIERDGEREDLAAAKRLRRASMSIKMPPARATAETAFLALEYLPMPVLVLSDSKQIILANEAMGRLLGIDAIEEEEGDSEDYAGDDEGCLPEVKRTTSDVSPAGFPQGRRGCVRIYMVVVRDTLVISRRHRQD